jgi:glycosyltransferase involved in cell wall biosynthesis
LVVAGPGWDSDYGREVRALIDEANRSIASTANCKLQTADSVPIHAVGMLSGAAKWGALYGCDAFVLPSHQENFGIAVVEALACGKPVLISDQVNIWREIADADAGFVEADTEDGAVRLLKRFMVREDAPEMAERARECYLSRFAIGPAASNFAQVLKHGAINPG